MRLPRRALAALLAVPLLLAGCAGSSSGGGSGGGGGAAGSGGGSAAAGGSSAGTSAAAATASPPGGGKATTGSAGAWGSMAGCPSVGRAIPPGAHSAPTVDVDGDGRPDTAFIAAQPDAQGAVAFGVRTASGGVFSTTLRSASPVARSVLFADVTGKGEVIALGSDGRQVQLWAVSRCQLIAEKNAQGRQYAFDLGFTGFGTGVGCADANGDGTPELLGLKLVGDANGNPTSIQRTIITLKGPQARNGARSTVSSPAPAQVQAATAVTCGTLTMSANGVTSGP